MAGNRVIQSLWIGDRLSTMERLAIRSFIANGHEYHLYTYEDVRNVPEGTVVNDAAEIVPASLVFRYDNGSYAGFANLFRYRLLLERGGWWVDTDAVCVRPFAFASEHVFSSELVPDTLDQVVTSGFIKAPAESPVIRFAWEEADRKRGRRLVWGETGPRLLQEAVSKLGLERCVQPYTTFCPTSWTDVDALVDPNGTRALADDTCAVHLWNEVWRRRGLDKDAAYPAGCLYERLKRKYL